jgi:uncharacterized protein (TIGR02246 family)
MTIQNSRTSDQAQIQQLVDNWMQALRAKDVNGVMSHYAPDVLVFDLAPPLQYKGADAYRENWEGWFPTFQGPIGYEIRDLNIAANDDIAFCHSFNRITGTRTDGEKTDAGCALRFAVARSTADGRLCTSINRCLSIWMAATERRLTSCRRMTVIGVRTLLGTHGCSRSRAILNPAGRPSFH